MKKKTNVDSIVHEIEANHSKLPLFFQELEFKKTKLSKTSDRKISSSYYNTKKLEAFNFYKPILRIEK